MEEVYPGGLSPIPKSKPLFYNTKRTALEKQHLKLVPDLTYAYTCMHTSPPAKRPNLKLDISAHTYNPRGKREEDALSLRSVSSRQVRDA